jgi:nicotinamide-nucleotide amidase
MRAEILSIGDELTSGQRLDTNSQWLAERLLEIGVPVAFHTTVGDNLADNVLAFREAIERADVIVATGGLGPTADDLTRFALAELAGVPLVQDDASLAHIRALFARRKREMPPANVVQAQFPRDGKPIPNPHGSAPGIDMAIARPEKSPARIFALPGVPAEMKEMWAASVAPAIQQFVGSKRLITHYRVKCFGVGESDLEAMLPDLIARQRYPLVGITVSQATITLRITAEGETAEAARAAMQPTIETIQNCLGNLIFGYEDDELQHAVARTLHERRQTVAVVEWGTAGLLSHWLSDTELPNVLKSGLVMPNAIGLKLLESYRRLDATSEAISEDPITFMAREGLKQPGTDYVLVVGPHGEADSATTAPASVVLALAHGTGVIRKETPFAGHPEILQPRLAKQALNLLRLHLLGKA